MTGRRWLRAASDKQWVLATTDQTTGVMANPTAAFVPQVTGSTVRLDASGSFSTNGPITAYSWDAGDGTTSSAKVWSHDYSQSGTFPVRLSVTDSLGRTATYIKQVTIDVSVSGNKSPIPAFSSSLGADGRTVSFDGVDSTDPDGTIASYRWSFGDGSPAVTTTVPTVDHTYTTDGTFNPTLTVTDNSGGTGAISHPVTTRLITGGGTPYVPPWTLGSWDEGLPTSLVVAEYADIYNTLSASDRASESVLIKVIAALPAYLASKGWGSHAAIHFPSGYDGLIPGFSQGSDTYAHGFGSTALIGLLGGVSNGKLQARLRMKPDSMTPGQLNTIQLLTNTGANGSGYTTNPFTAIYMAGSSSGQPQYLAGMEFDGADMQIVTDYRETGPANWSGITFYHPGAGAFMQNCLLRGFGHATSTSPPGETGAAGATHDSGATYRRVEVDGRLPGGSRRSGGFLWSGSFNPVVSDVWVHDTYTSGPSFSFAGSIAPSNASTNITTTRFRSENNANHEGYVSGKRFAALNHEEPQGFVVHNGPMVGLDPSTNPYWDSTHMSYSNVGMPADDVAASFTVHDPVVLDAATGGAYVGDNGCFSIKTKPSASVNLQTPVVTKNGVPLQPWVRTGAGQAPSYVTPDTHFILKQQG